MKKMMLGLVVGAMMLAMVGCGDTKKEAIGEVIVDTETNVEVEENVTVEPDNLSDEVETIVVRATVTGAPYETFPRYEGDVEIIKTTFMYLIDGEEEYEIIGIRFPIGTEFKSGDIVNLEFLYSKEENKILDKRNIVSWEKVEE